MRCVNETRHYWVGYNARLPDGRHVIGKALSPVFRDEAEARQALAKIRRTHPDARLIRVTDLDEG